MVWYFNGVMCERNELSLSLNKRDQRASLSGELINSPG